MSLTTVCPIFPGGEPAPLFVSLKNKTYRSIKSNLTFCTSLFFVPHSLCCLFVFASDFFFLENKINI